MNIKAKRRLVRAVYHILVCLFGVAMIYPLLWMVFSSFKQTNTIFTSAGQLLPDEWVLTNYQTGWRGFAGISFGVYFRNSFFICILSTLGVLLSSSIVGYGLARCRFRGHKLLFSAMLLTMMLPAQVLMIPQYLWYNNLGWIGSYLPIIVPDFFAVQGFFTYLMVNFIDGIPRELDEAARIDGCSYYAVFRRIILPLIVPALITASIFSFIWKWDDFLSALLYINDPAQYPVCLALKLFSDPSSSSDYGAMFAMATLSVVPIMLIFMFLQKYLVEGISTSGLKG